MRLDQFISQITSFSRSEAKICIRQNRVQVNQIICRNAHTKLLDTDEVQLDNKVVEWPKELYFMLNKPLGYCCSHEDDGHVSALKLLPETRKKLHFAGRLDADTTGLVLLSSDGQWCHRVTSPKQRVEKRKEKHYQVGLRDPLEEDSIKTLEAGVLLKGETQITLPAKINLTSEKCCEIVITEGRYHQIKRMFAAVGNQVQSLKRFKIADIHLPEDLALGEYRPLTNEEIKQFTHDL